MSYREITMQEIEEVFRRKQAGQSERQIARETGLNRKTIKRYFETALVEGMSTGAVTEVEAAWIARQVQERPSPPVSDAWQMLEQQRHRIEAWLRADTPLRLVRIHELLARDGVRVGYTTLRRFARRELEWSKRQPTVRLLDRPPGEEAQIDFGLMGRTADEDGRQRKLWVLIVTLNFSRYQFVYPTWTQTTEDVCAGLDAAWKFFDGIPKHIVLDNMSAAVVQASKTDPRLGRSFLEYTQARNVFADTARVAKAKDKARVENQVPYVRERWFSGEQLSTDLVEIRRHAECWCRDIAGGRVHGTTRQVPREVYDAEERSHMQPAPTKPFDVPTWTTCKVHPDHHVQVNKALYSIPTRHIGKTLDARLDRTTVRFYLHNEMVKAHGLVAPGKRSTDPNDFPPGKSAWAMRDIDVVIEQCHKHGSHVGEFAARLLSGSIPWLKLRQGYGLVRLCERYGADRVNALCARALGFDVIDVPRIERMLRDARQVEDEGVAKGRVIPLPARFARDPSSFATRPRPTQEIDREGGGQ